MKVRFLKIGVGFNGQDVIHYIKETKKHWWNRWQVVMEGAAPLLFYKLPEGVKAVNELPRYINMASKIPASPPPFTKGDASIRKSMMDMVRNADEVYVGIREGDKYYVATDTISIQSCRDLQTLEIMDEDS